MRWLFLSIILFSAFAQTVCWPSGSSTSLTNPSQSPFLTINGANYKAGDKIKLGAKIYRILSYVDSGTRGNVFQVADSSGKLYALKVPKAGLSFTQDSLQEEVKVLFPLLERTGVKHPKVVAHGKDYLLRTWSEGTLGTKWEEQWEDSGHSQSFPGYRQLIALFGKLAHQGVYIGDLKPTNMVWNGRSWEVFDTTYENAGLNPEEQYLNDIDENWPSFRSQTSDCILRQMRKAISK